MWAADSPACLRPAAALNLGGRLLQQEGSLGALGISRAHGSAAYAHTTFVALGSTAAGPATCLGDYGSGCQSGSNSLMPGVAVILVLPVPSALIIQMSAPA